MAGQITIVAVFAAGVGLDLVLGLVDGPAVPYEQWDLAVRLLFSGGAVTVMLIWATDGTGLATVVALGVYAGLVGILTRRRVLASITEHVLIAYVPVYVLLLWRHIPLDAWIAPYAWASAGLVTVMAGILTASRRAPRRWLRVSAYTVFLWMLIAFLGLQITQGQLDPVLGAGTSEGRLWTVLLTGAVFGHLVRNAALLVWPILLLRFDMIHLPPEKELTSHANAFAASFGSAQIPRLTGLVVLAGLSGLLILAEVAGWDPWLVPDLVIVGAPLLSHVATSAPHDPIRFEPVE